MATIEADIQLNPAYIQSPFSYDEPLHMSDATRRKLSEATRIAHENYHTNGPAQVIVEIDDTTHETELNDATRFYREAILNAPNDVLVHANTSNVESLIDENGRLNIPPKYETIEEIDIESRFKELAPWIELAHGSLISQRKGEINGHGMTHIEEVARISDELLSYTGHVDLTRKQAQLAVLYHDIGNAQGRTYHSRFSSFVFRDVEKGIKQYSNTWKEINTAINCHESDSYNALREPLLELSGKSRIEMMRKHLGATWAAVTAADKLHEGRDRFSELQNKAGALEGHDHSTINLLFRLRRHGPKIVRENGNEIKAYTIEVGYNPLLSKADGSLQKYAALAQDPDAEESYVAVPDKFRKEYNYNEPDFDKLRLRRGQLYRDRMEITLEAIFVLDPNLSEVEWLIHDEVENRTVTHRFRLEHLNEDLERFRKEYPKKDDDIDKSIEEADA